MGWIEDEVVEGRPLQFIRQTRGQIIPVAPISVSLSSQTGVGMLCCKGEVRGKRGMLCCIVKVRGDVMSCGLFWMGRNPSKAVKMFRQKLLAWRCKSKIRSIARSLHPPHGMISPWVEGMKPIKI